MKKLDNKLSILIIILYTIVLTLRIVNLLEKKKKIINFVIK